MTFQLNLEFVLCQRCCAGSDCFVLTSCSCFKKCIRGRCPQYFKEYFKCNGSVHQRATRQKNQLHLPAVRTETAKRSFYYYGCTVFNSFMQ